MQLPRNVDFLKSNDVSLDKFKVVSVPEKELSVPRWQYYCLLCMGPLANNSLVLYSKKTSA